jgi:hypothetical protein
MSKVKSSYMRVTQDDTVVLVEMVSGVTEEEFASASDEIRNTYNEATIRVYAQAMGLTKEELMLGAEVVFIPQAEYENYIEQLQAATGTYNKISSTYTHRGILNGLTRPELKQ